MEERNAIRLSDHVSVLRLNARVEQVLLRHRISTVAMLLSHSRNDLMMVNGIGLAAIADIERCMLTAGLRLGTAVGAG